MTTKDLFENMLADLLMKELEIQSLQEQIDMKDLQISLLESLVDFMKDKVIKGDVE